jgi:anti-sigma factor RsiW
MAEPNNCHHLLGSLSDYLDGEISDALCAEIERHLANCNNCRVVVDTLRQTIQLYRALSDPDLPEAARERLYQSLDLTDFLPES